jgi:hypothetical protein
MPFEAVELAPAVDDALAVADDCELLHPKPATATTNARHITERRMGTS